MDGPEGGRRSARRGDLEGASSTALAIGRAPGTSPDPRAVDALLSPGRAVRRRGGGSTAVARAGAPGRPADGRQPAHERWAALAPARPPRLPRLRRRRAAARAGGPRGNAGARRMAAGRYPEQPSQLPDHGP